MNDKELLNQWKKGSIRIGSPTNILAALTSFIPVIWLCTTYDCWPPVSTVLTAWGMVAASFGAFYFVEPVSYYAALGMTGTYLSFLSGNIGNMRVPCAALALDVTKSETGSLQAEIVSTMAISAPHSETLQLSIRRSRYSLSESRLFLKCSHRFRQQLLSFAPYSVLWALQECSIQRICFNQI